MASSLDLLVRQWAPVNASENWRLKWKWKGWKHVNWNGKRSRRNWLFSVYNFSFFQLKAHEMPWESFGFLSNQMASCKMSSWHWQTRSFEVHWRLQRLDMAPSFAFEEFVGFCTSIWKRLCCSKSLFLFATFQLFGVQDGTFEISLSLSLFLSLLYHTSIISSCRQYLVYLLSMFHVFLCPWICLYLCVFRKAWDGEYDGYDGYDYEGYWNDWSSSWSEWGSSWQSRDRRVGGQCYRRWHLRMPCNTMQRKMAHDCTTTLQHELHVERTGRLQKVLRKVLRKVIRKALHGITQSPRLATKRTSKRIQNPVTSCNPVSHVAQRKEAWQEWDWEEDLWDEASEWDEYITVKEWILKRLMLEVKGNCLNGEGGATWCWDVVCITNHFDFLMNTVLFWPDLLSQKGNKLSQTPWHLVPLIAAYTGLHCSCWA